MSHFWSYFSWKVLRNAYFEQFSWKIKKKSAIFCTFIFYFSAPNEAPYMSHFSAEFSQKWLVDAYFAQFHPKFEKKSAIFCTLIFLHFGTCWSWNPAIYVPYMSHFLADFWTKSLKYAYFERFLGKIEKKSAIFVHFYFLSWLSGAQQPELIWACFPAWPTAAPNKEFLK